MVSLQSVSVLVSAIAVKHMKPSATDKMKSFAAQISQIYVVLTRVHSIVSLFVLLMVPNDWMYL